MIRLRRILPTQLLQTAQQMTLQQDCLSASLPSAPQLWGGHLQQSSCMATPKPAQKPPSLHERRLANFEYCKARKAWRRQLGKLRTEWLRQYNSRLAHKRQEAEAVKQQMQQLRQLQSTTTQTDRTRDTLDRQLRDAERAYEMALIRNAAAVREEFRQKTLQQYQQQRRAELLEASRQWIPQDQLEARIAAALDNPAHL